MRRLLILGMLLVVPGWSSTAQAQGLFSKRARPNPNQRVPELIYIIKSEGDERKRANAAEELQSFDARTYAEIVPVLIDVAQNDQKASVRQEALGSLARIRPVSQAAGQALERAAAQDESWRIRLQAKSALMKYHLAGYASSGKAETASALPRNVTTAEPPLLDAPAAAPAPAPSNVQSQPPHFPAAALPAQPLQARPMQVSPPVFATPTPQRPVSATPTARPSAATPAQPSAPITIEVEGPSLTPQP